MNDPDALQRITRLPISREECLGKAKELIEAVQKAKAKNPVFAKTLKLMGQRARVSHRIDKLHDLENRLLVRTAKLREKLSPEERELL